MKDKEEMIGQPALLEQLAEEASKLTQAALKYARILRDENPTPVTKYEAYTNTIEEFTDVIQCARELRILVDEEQIKYKDERWTCRIEKHKNKGDR